MFHSPEEASRRLNHPDNVLRVMHEGQGTGPRLDAGKRTLIGVLAQFDTQRNVAKEFGVSQPTVSSAERGMVGARVDKEQLENVRSVLGTVRETALLKLQETLGLITRAELAEAPLRTKAAVAKEMASIVEKVSGNDKNPGSGISVHIYGPRERSESDYNVVSVTDAVEVE